jgi:hypothetical protein
MEALIVGCEVAGTACDAGARCKLTGVGRGHKHVVVYTSFTKGFDLKHDICVLQFLPLRVPNQGKQIAIAVRSRYIF